MKTIQDIAYHRNGISGEGFHVVAFTEDDTKMVAVVFPLNEGETWNGRVAVFDLEKLGAGVIEFGLNSWRGDRYETWLRTALAED